jgi:hypothetical protein
LRTGLQPELLIYGLHRIGIKIDAYVVIFDNQSRRVSDEQTRRKTLMGGRIFILPVLQELEEFLRPALFEETHQWAFDCLHFGAGNLGDLAVAIDEAARDLLELEVASDISVHEDFREFSGCDDELWDEIDSVIPITTEPGGGSLICSELSVELGEAGSETVSTYHVGHRPG